MRLPTDIPTRAQLDAGGARRAAGGGFSPASGKVFLGVSSYPITYWSPTSVSSVALAACSDTDQVLSPTTPSAPVPPQL